VPESLKGAASAALRSIFMFVIPSGFGVRSKSGFGLLGQSREGSWFIE
jgi:hypothetical protein